MTDRFPLSISYAQIAVFDLDMETPFNDWNDRHYTQGFSWREGSVSFAIPDGNRVFVEVLTDGEQSQLVGEPTRFILVPFDAPNDDVAIASILNERSTTIGSGKYQLSFELLPGNTRANEPYERFVRLTFSRNETPIFEIIRGDSEMVIDLPLDKNAVAVK
ncbi:competence protein ComJ [Bradyrhizobium sp. LHD-71]|uniref:competence protein ComJ n=1 Tax=Bradyrhizobium sp. LHD-71 TaxID=3072141 RepID=UPI00280C48D3|nr:competence protein ComJ [Bradyrhizobium sp. LHD-71]MDQ8731069.1 competence protein ComJ [Bradyrhizobium sp. LHD-71]